jgi:hypothetical protein
MEAIKNFAKENPIATVTVVIFIIYLIYISMKNKKESSFNFEYTDPKHQMRAMMGMGNYGSVLGCREEDGKKCY